MSNLPGTPPSMPDEVLVFGYQSLLARGSLAANVGEVGESYIPVRLRGFARDWSAVRDFATNPAKRYVRAADWSVVGRVAFANLHAMPGLAVNGLCRRVPAGRLAEIDFREQGYTRVEVGDRVACYAGHALPQGMPCYAYIDVAPSSSAAPVSRAYYDMGWHGALALDRELPGFAADFQATTLPPAEIADDLVFVFISRDGRHLWLLNEADSSLVLLLRFAVPQFQAEGSEPPEAQRPVTSGLEWLDLRGTRAAPARHPRIPDDLARELCGSPGAELAASRHWLSRLTAIESGRLSHDRLVSLCDDPDAWVRRAARLHIGDPA